MGEKEIVKNNEFSYFKFQADLGITNHLGGLQATRKLAESCNISKGKHVLNVGCGVGASSCYIAEKYGSGVMGVDISRAMIEKARERAKKRKLDQKVKFQLADATNLPFENKTFDIVISESVNAFIENRKKALLEYKRVCKFNGYVGLNEVTWNKPHPPDELQEYLSYATGIKEILTCNGWTKLIEECGLKKVISDCHGLNILWQWVEEVRTLSIKDNIKAWIKFFNFFLKDPNFRIYARKLYPSFRVVMNIINYFGYCLYVSRKH
jgi:arsenite methyltransferase